MQLTNATDLFSLGQQIVPWVALVVAVGSAIVSYRSFCLAKLQADERKASIIITLNDLWFSRKADGQRTYVLDMSVINRASVANSIITVEMITVFSLKTGHEIRLRTPLIVGQGTELPFRLDSFQAVSHTFKFLILQNTIPADARIDSYEFEFTEQSGRKSNISPTLVIEKRE